MENGLLDRFEQQIEALLQNYTRLKQDNKLLRQKQSQLINECDILRDKHQLAASSIEKIIERLRVIENHENT